MLTCPVCASKQTTVLDSRPIDASVRRRRCCVKCDERWTTYEVSADAYNALHEVDQVLDAARTAMAGHLIELDRLRTEGRSVKTDAGIETHRTRRVGSFNGKGQKIGGRVC